MDNSKLILMRPQKVGQFNLIWRMFCASDAKGAIFAYLIDNI